MHAFITSFCLCIVNFFFPRKAYTRSCNISTTLNLFYYCFSLVQVQTVVLLVSSFSHLICCLIISFGFQEVPYLIYSNIKIICSCSVFYFLLLYCFLYYLLSNFFFTTCHTSSECNLLGYLLTYPHCSGSRWKLLSDKDRLIQRSPPVPSCESFAILEMNAPRISDNKAMSIRWNAWKPCWLLFLEAGCCWTLPVARSRFLSNVFESSSFLRSLNVICALLRSCCSPLSCSVSRLYSYCS